MHGEAVHPALGLGDAPGRRIFGVEGGIGDVDGAAVVGDLVEAERGTHGDAVVEAVDDRAVEAQPIDQAGVEIGDEELRRGGIIDDVAETGAGVGGDGRKQRDLAGGAIDLPDAARIALGAAGTAPLSGHEAGIGRPGLAADGISIGTGDDEIEAEGRGRGEIDIGGGRAAHFRSIVEGDAEDLSDILGRRAKNLGGGNHLARRRPVRLELLDDHRLAVEIDEGAVQRIARGGRRSRRHDPGKPGDDRLARRKDRVARKGVRPLKRHHNPGDRKQCGR